MKQTKRKRNPTNYVNDKNKRKKFHDKIISINTSITHFEDLSNEFFYEIFDFLDVYHIYKGFFHINQRFKNLLVHSTVPMKINIFSMSKSKFEDYYLHIIKPNKHRIISLHLSNLFLVNIILSPPRIISEFLRLETLIFDQIEAKHLENILNYASSLPNLSSLIINSLDYVNDSNFIYHQLFRLRTLKYCKISNCNINDSLFSSNTNYQNSPIEHFIIGDGLDFDQFDRLLSCFTQLRRLSIQCLDGAFSKRTEISPITLNHLTHLSMELHMIDFNQFEKIIQDSFHQLQVLRISTARDITYVNAHRWEHLILFHMINLRIFDMNYSMSKHDDDFSSDLLTNNFNSSFWIERKSIFTHQQNWRGNIQIKVFYSIDSSSRKINCNSFKIKDIHNGLFQSRINLCSIDHVHICNMKGVNNCENFFPNVTSLSFDHNFDAPYNSFATNLIRIIPLVQIIKLVIKDFGIRFEQLLEILRLTPNLQTLKYCSISLSDEDCKSIQQNECFLLVSNTNNIKTVNFGAQCSIEEIKLLVSLFPYVEHLNIRLVRKEFESSIRFLLSKTNNITCRLFFLRILGVPKVSLKEIKKVIKSEKFLNNYLINYFDRDIYLWW